MLYHLGHLRGATIGPDIVRPCALVVICILWSLDGADRDGRGGRGREGRCVPKVFMVGWSSCT
jgi:hypothetical protein